MSFTCHGIDDGRFRLRLFARALKRKEVVHHASGSALQDFPGITQGMLDMIKDRSLCKVGYKTFQRVALAISLLSHNRGTDHHSQSVEGDLGTVFISIG